MLNIVQSSQVTVMDVLVSVSLAFGLGLLISTVYKKTFKGISYSQSFATSIALLTPITAIVMLTIGSNLARAFGLVGALSIVRFRTVVKDTKDIMTIFLSLVVGLSVGTQNYHIAMIGSILVLGFIIALDKINYGAFAGRSYLITFTVPQNKINEKDYEDIIDKYSGDHQLINIGSVDVSKGVLEITYKIEDVSAGDRQSITEDLSKLSGVKSLSIVSSKNYVEY